MPKDKGPPTGKAAMRRFEDLLSRIFSVAKDDLNEAEQIAEEIEEVIERHEEPTPDE
jgi:hypothetical protein